MSHHLLRWDDSRYPLIVSECNRFIVDAENSGYGAYAIHLTNKGPKNLGWFDMIDAAKFRCQRESERPSIEKKFSKAKGSK
jgi:hypothetical protein